MTTPKRTGTPKKLLFCLLPVLLLLLGTEGLLRFIDYRSPIEDPYESFVAQRPLFERRGDQMVVAPARQGRFHSTTFAAAKPRDHIRIFVVGGSTTYGLHLENPEQDCYAGQLERILTGRLDAPVNVINCGASAYASYRLTRIVEETASYSPDVIVIMTGHNEFLEPVHYAHLIESRSEPWYLRLRLVVAIRTLCEMVRPELTLSPVNEPAVGLEPFEKYAVRDDKEFEYALEHFRRNLNRMADAGAAHDVPVILCTTTSNLRDFAPFYSVSRVYSEELLQSRMDIIEDLIDREEYESALDEVQSDLARDDGVAVFHFLAAKALEGLGRFEAARTSYLRAKDTDRFPHRALSSFNNAIREIAADRKTPLLDAELLFEGESEHGIPGANLFLDNCHPTEKGHRLLAEALATQIAELLTEKSK